jgi:hypothetical protein
MRRLLFSVCTLCMVLVACSDKDKIPGNVIPRDRMEKILWDMIQAERFSTSFLVKDSGKNVKEGTFILYEQVFRLHKITKDEFVKSYKFYLSRPDIARVMFDSLASHANRAREEMYKTPAKDSAKTNTPKTDTVQKNQVKPMPLPAPVQDTASLKAWKSRRDSIRIKPLRSRTPKAI